MFSKRSRYFKQKTVGVEVKNAGGEKRSVNALSLRRLPLVRGVPLMVQEKDRLDYLAFIQYQDGARFWHVADANTCLQADELLDETGQIIAFPEE